MKDKEKVIKIPFNNEEQADAETKANVDVQSETELDSQFTTLQDELEKARVELADTKDTFIRLRADFDNYRRRVRQEQLEYRRRGIEEFVETLLPVVDNLDLALKSTKEAQSVEAIAKGLHLIQKQMVDVLKKYDIVPIDAKGKPFDPNVHEAIHSIPKKDIEVETVIEEVQRGYQIADKVLRPSKVVVAVRAEDE